MQAASLEEWTWEGPAESRGGAESRAESARQAAAWQDGGACDGTSNRTDWHWALGVKGGKVDVWLLLLSPQAAEKKRETTEEERDQSKQPEETEQALLRVLAVAVDRLVDWKACESEGACKQVVAIVDLCTSTVGGTAASLTGVNLGLVCGWDHRRCADEGAGDDGKGRSGL